MASMKDKVFPQKKTAGKKTDSANFLIQSIAAEEKAMRDRKTQRLKALRELKEAEVAPTPTAE